MVIKRNENIVARKVHGSFFLIDISDNYSGDKCALYELNEIGMFIWENINGSRNIVDIVTLLKAAIIDDIDYQILYDDVSEYIDTLVDKGFIEV